MGARGEDVARSQRWGWGAASLWPRLLSAGPDADPAMRVSAEPSLGSAPSVVGLVTDVVTEVLENHLIGMRLITAAVSGVLQSVHGRLLEGRTPTRTDSQLPSISGPVPNTVLNAPLTRRRSVAFDTILLADVKAVSEAFGAASSTSFWLPAPCHCVRGCSGTQRCRTIRC